jgi:hypothetical protein
MMVTKQYPPFEGISGASLLVVVVWGNFLPVFLLAIRT